MSADLSYTWQVLEGLDAGASDSGSVEFEAEAAPNDSGNWSLAFEVDLPDGTTKLSFEFENRLTAQATTDLSSASIGKKVFEGIQITVVPEPAAVALLLIGLGTLAIWRRR